MKNNWKNKSCIVAIVALFSLLPHAFAAEKDSGYRGIWYFNQPTNDEYAYKYSGGLGTYCADHIPMAIYSKEADKTFFVYGGTQVEQKSLLEMVSYYDHKTGEVPRPTILIDKKTDDAHDNPVLSIDDEGYLWVFASSHGKGRPSYIFKSKTPHSIEDFETVMTTNFSYPQPWHVPGKGFIFLHTSYDGGRVLYWQTSEDGRTWNERKCLAKIEEGHYQVSWMNGNKIGTAFNRHPKAFRGDPKQKGLNWRTDLYYVETGDMGKTWQTASGEPTNPPLNVAANPALVRNYENEGSLVYIMDLAFDGYGHPAILYNVSDRWAPGPEGGMKQWRISHWNDGVWRHLDVAKSDNNYDMGSLYIEPDGTWRIIGPIEKGPQEYNPGGEIVMLTSTDEGATWDRKQITTGSEFNHTYCRKVLNGNNDFYAFWADGHGRKPSTSRIYFTVKDGTSVFQLPVTMTTEYARPVKLSR
jgi:hypothetical protein